MGQDSNGHSKMKKCSLNIYNLAQNKKNMKYNGVYILC